MRETVDPCLRVWLCAAYRTDIMRFTIILSNEADKYQPPKAQAQKLTVPRNDLYDIDGIPMGK